MSANFAVDMWQTFEGALTAAGLAANDNNGDLTNSHWSVTNPNSQLSVDAAGEKAVAGTFNSISDSGSQGLIYDTGDTAAGNVGLFFPTAVTGADNNTVSFGFWFSAPSGMIGGFREHDILRVEGPLGDRILFLKVVGDPNLNLRIFTPEENYSDPIALSADTWYWITVRYTRNTSPNGWRVQVYDDTGAQVGVERVRISGDDIVWFMTIGSHIGAEDPLGGNLRFDDLVMDWSDATFPLGPAIPGTPTGQPRGKRMGGVGFAPSASGGSGVKIWKPPMRPHVIGPSRPIQPAAG